MNQQLLSIEEVLIGYDAVSQLYPHIPPMLLWRSWEYAAYQRYTLVEPVLDIGCGDGRYFHLVFPDVQNVTGVDMDPAVVEAARRSGVYREILTAPAHQLLIEPGSFASAFANCSLEHMDHLPEVLNNIALSLSPRAPFLLSVVTDKFIKWTALPTLVERIGEPARARLLQADYETYHHLVNPFPIATWAEYLDAAGFDVLEHIPILPEMTSRLFLFLDHLWHVRQGSRELGDLLYPYLKSIERFPQAFRKMMAGVLEMEKNWTIASGAVFWARKR
jgi:SAM-dependent methyltransferase